MQPRLFGTIVAVASCLVAATPAQALICYVVYNRSENVIYQNTYPPVDMSAAGRPQRDAMRARGEHMTFGDVNSCPTVVFVFGSGGSIALNVDDVVAGLPVRSFSTNTAAAAAVSNAEGVRPGGPTPTGFRSPVAKPGSGGY